MWQLEHRINMQFIWYVGNVLFKYIFIGIGMLSTCMSEKQWHLVNNIPLHDIVPNSKVAMPGIFIAQKQNCVENFNACTHAFVSIQHFGNSTFLWTCYGGILYISCYITMLISSHGSFYILSLIFCLAYNQCTCNAKIN